MIPKENTALNKETEYLHQTIAMFCCPKCNGDLKAAENSLDCVTCGSSYPIIDGIPRLFYSNEWDTSQEDVTDKMKSFYEENPFPSYDDFDSAASLIDKARQGLFAKLLDDQIPFGTRVIECGCGTGQLSNFLSIANRTLIGVDMCINSLKLARNFKDKNSLDRAHFYQMNLFRPCFKPQSFGLVISNGVLHHTSDPYQAFVSIANLVSPGGYILIGLYHKYGRLATDVRRVIFNVTKDKFKFLDRHAVDEHISSAKRKSWFMDQYKNPHESKHTVTEVLGWLDKVSFKFVYAIPKTVPFVNIDESERIFKPDKLGNWFDRVIVNTDMIIKGHKEGGFFIIIARKPKA
ncbi:MAG: methyltransferase domain-containing protein [Cytophagaceae bacterium]|nr:methyltransferase domain-containing protein [Cytophagaceae bacterium]